MYAKLIVETNHVDFNYTLSKEIAGLEKIGYTIVDIKLAMSRDDISALIMCRKANDDENKA